MEENKSERIEWYDSSMDLSLSSEELIHKASKKVSHLGDVQEFEHKSNKNVVLSKEITITDPNKLTEDSLRTLKQRLHLRHPNLLKIYGYMLDSSKATNAALSVFFESFSSDAATEFEVLRKEKKYLQEDELYNSLMDVLQALGFLQQHSIAHGNLTPESIFMSQKGEIKLLDDSLFEDEYSVFRDCLNGAQIPYMSPELFHSLRKEKNSDIRVNKFKSDAFSVGMIFLYGALLEEPSNCYNWETFTFYPSRLYDRCEQLRKRYHGQFANVISHLLRLDPNERPDAQQVLANIEYYQKYHWYFRDPKYNTTESYGTVKNLVAQVLADTHRPKSRASPSRQDTSSYHADKRDISGTASYKPDATEVNFIDPKVREIMRDVQGGRQNPKYEYEHPSYDGPSQRVSHNSPLRYNTAFDDDMERLEPHFKLYSPEGYRLAHSSPSREHSEYREELSRYEPEELRKNSFNSPHVNQVIAEIRDFYRKNPQYLQNPDTSSLSPNKAKRIAELNDEKLASVDRLLNQSGHRYETPQRDVEQRKDDYYRADGDSNKISPSSTYQLTSDKKSQSKEEIIQELKERYRNRVKNQEKQEVKREVIFTMRVLTYLFNHAL